MSDVNLPDGIMFWFEKSISTPLPFDYIDPTIETIYDTNKFVVITCVNCNKRHAFSLNTKYENCTSCLYKFEN